MLNRSHQVDLPHIFGSSRRFQRACKDDIADILDYDKLCRFSDTFPFGNLADF